MAAITLHNTQWLIIRNEHKINYYYYYYKQLLDEVFVISGIIKVKVSVISRSRRLRLITLTETLIIPDMTKTESNNCFIIHCFEENNEKRIIALPHKKISTLRLIPFCRRLQNSRFRKAGSAISVILEWSVARVRTKYDCFAVNSVTILPSLRQLCQVPDPDVVFPKLSLVASY